jgi:thiol-disulfide isomerase/thioredoxin
MRMTSSCVKRQVGLLLLLLSAPAIAEAGTIVRVEGRVVDTAGKPVAGTRVSEDWMTEQGGPLAPYRPRLSGADGTFSLEMELYARDRLVMAVDATGHLGGVATIPFKTPQKPIEIKLSPLVEIRVRYSSEKSGVSLPESFLSVSLTAGKLPVARGRSRASTFAMKLPPGHYTLQEEGGDDNHAMDVRNVTLEPGKPLDLGERKLRFSTRARLYGKPAPLWHIADARGVPKEVQPADFKGKWVVLEFWGYWCGSCTGRGLPEWMDFVDDHVADRDKFVILAVHERNVTDFAMLDEKLKPIISRVWRGRPLPFPILLDTTGAMIKDYGVNGFPTAVLLDPEGRVVDFARKPGDLGSHVCEEFLASKLTPIPPAKRIDRALDRTQSLGVDDEPLNELMSFYGRVARIPIRLDRNELKAAGLEEAVRVPLKVGGRLTLRSWLNLTLDPLGLTYVADGDGLRIVRRSPGNVRLSQPSPRQEAENALVSAALKKKVTLEFHGESLKQVVAMLDATTDETFLLDPSARLSHAITPDRSIHGSVVDEPLSSALNRLLTPLGMTYVIRDEAVILTNGR